jgi:anti-sigma factor RsiW
MTELSDDLLVAYVDGGLQRAQRLAVEKVLGQDEVLAARVDALKEAHSRLESAFDAILAGATGDVMAQMPVLPPRPVKPRGNALTKVGMAIAGVGLALAALVAGYGWPLVNPDGEERRHIIPIVAGAENWKDQVLQAQSLLARASVEVSPESQANQDLLQLQLAQALGPGARLPDLKAAGFNFMRGQLLSFRGRPLAQILYLGAAKPPLALYAMREDGEGADANPAFREFGTLGSVSWNEGGMSYLLAGEEAEQTLRRLAETIRRDRPAAAVPANSPAASDPVVTGSN